MISMFGPYKKGTLIGHRISDSGTFSCLWGLCMVCCDTWYSTTISGL